MKPAFCLLLVLLAATPAGVRAQTPQTSTVDVGNALYGCSSATYFAKVARYAMDHKMRAYAKALLDGIRTGQCVAFTTGQHVVLVETANRPLLAQVKLETGGPSYWTVKQWLKGAQPPLPQNFGNVVTQLYVGDAPNQPLVVAVRGSGGGNDWATDRYEEERNAFLKRGYAVLALGYFAGRHHGTKMQALPQNLDRISLNAIHKAILKAAKKPKIDRECIAVVGSSRGGELALLLGSYFDDIKAVVAMKPADVAYFAGTPPFSTSSWYYNEKPVPFVPLDGRAMVARLQQKSGDGMKVIYDIVRQDDAHLDQAKIRVENINGPVLLISGASDAKWPSTKMSDLIVDRLKAHDFPYFYEHITVKGGHEAPEQHFDAIRNFLDRYFKSGADSGCARE